jgi:hypothetical protein
VSTPAHAAFPSSSPSVKRATSPLRHSAAASVRRDAGSAGRSRTSASAASAAATGTVSQATRQPASVTAPTTGIPAIQAAGIPTIAQASTCARSPGAAHTPAAAIPPATSRPIPAPSTPWDAASTGNDGAAAVATAPSATRPVPHDSNVRSPARRGTSASSTAVSPPAAPEIERSCPAAAVETPNSLAISGSVGDSTSSAACEANRHMKRTAAGRIVTALSGAPS